MSASSAVAHNHHDADSHGHEHHHGHDHHELSFIQKYIFSTDHKVIARQFMFSALFFLFIGGFFALLIRWQLAYPGKAIPIIGNLLPSTWVTDGIIQASFYTQLLTMHGSVMIFLVIIPLAVGMFGNFCIPLMLGTDDMALPKLNMFSFWLMPPAAMITMGGFWFPDGMAAAGWTSYPPLAVINGPGQTCWLIGVFLIGFSSIMGGVNYITTILNKRTPGMTLFRMPLTVWALFITAMLIVLGTPVLAAALSMQFFDQFLGSSFFIPDNLVTTKKFVGGGQAVLFQHLFWFYSHPAVYIMILTPMGIVSDVLATFARKPLYGYKAMIFALMAIAFLGFIVWGHHMFQSGMNPLLGTTFMLSTIVIAVPSAIKIFNWLGTIWRGNIHFTAASMNALAFIATFIVGGLSGVFMASAPIDIYIHDTYFIVAHIHYVLFGGALFGIFAGIYYWFPKMFGKMLNENLGRKHFYWSFIFFNLTFFPMHILGVGGHMRRIYDPYIYDFLKPFQPMNEFITIAAGLLGFSQLILVVNILWTIKFGKKAPDNPWNANTLEWSAPTPPPHGNFTEDIRVYRGPYEYSMPGAKEDYAPQTKQDIPSEVEGEIVDESMFKAH
ncbi:MAG TPA: cbb3-type cytochrome c oxidase subunit I [Candidatus Kapabacteria bacterium]|jgi:cytochrome c oxidase subunit 1|nr:cbb3-type cytochrome c oxidase subunit I [Candidatus Kapabacteria bacterium]